LQRPLDDPQAMRHAGPDLLSLALIDARNALLALLAHDESPAALRLAARAGWFQEYWIARHVQRQRGEACDAEAPRLAGIEPHIDQWLAQGAEPPTPETLRGYLAETLEITLELLAALPVVTAADADDAGLHVYRNSLLHEDRLTEALAEGLQQGSAPARTDRDALWLPARRWMLGSPVGGLVPHNERWAHEVAVPEFEIDAQAVNWARFVEFAEDGGYDRRELWSDAGWAWVQAEGRRAPGGVEQIHGGVLVARGHGAGAGLQRVAAAQPAVRVARHEAEAWCRWAGRRLPTEPEWEIAASRGASRGFLWGDVFEWVAGSARAWPDAGAPAPGALDPLPAPAAGFGVLRGGSWATRARWKHPKARRFLAPADDSAFSGFRSCAL
jgi:formylglycine-generating enzyme required for sulfatase activity